MLKIAKYESQLLSFVLTWRDWATRYRNITKTGYFLIYLCKFSLENEIKGKYQNLGIILDGDV